jgi:uncharacterized protein YbjT (DUF2867 family)
MTVKSGDGMTERRNYWRESEKAFREGAAMARVNARSHRADGNENSAIEAERRAALYAKWADHDKDRGDEYERA